MLLMLIVMIITFHLYSCRTG